MDVLIRRGNTAPFVWQLFKTNLFYLSGSNYPKITPVDLTTVTAATLTLFATETATVPVFTASLANGKLSLNTHEGAVLLQMAASDWPLLTIDKYFHTLDLTFPSGLQPADSGLFIINSIGAR
jgi:hypothetical protein